LVKNEGSKFSRLYATETHIAEAGLNNSAAKIVPINSVIVAMYGQGDTAGRVAINKVEMATNQACCSLVIDPEIADYEYVYYAMTLNYEKLVSLKSGSAQPNLNTQIIKDFTIQLPPLEEQSAIAAILSCLDGKIANNTAINHHLEQMAQAIFKSWFVDFESNGTLGDISLIANGKRPPHRQAERTDAVNIPLIGASSVMGYTNAILYDEKILITGRVGTHGVIQRCSRPCWASDNTLVIKSDYYEFVYQQLCNVDFRNMNRGSTQPLITQTDLKNVPIYIPDKSILSEFEEFVGPLMERHQQNILESESLAVVRDALLPRLMSGEISLSTQMTMNKEEI